MTLDKRHLTKDAIFVTNKEQAWNREGGKDQEREL